MRTTKIDAGHYRTHLGGYTIIVERDLDADGRGNGWKVVVPQHGQELYGPGPNEFPAFITYTSTKREAVETGAWWVDTYGAEFAA